MAPSRRACLLALATLACFGTVRASTEPAPTAPSDPAGPRPPDTSVVLPLPPELAGLRRWGQGEFRRFGFLIYHATLWAGDDPTRPPLALRLDYARAIRGSAIVEASVQEMSRFISDDAQLEAWGQAMRRLFPDVLPGDHLLGVYRPDGAVFLHNGRPIGDIPSPAFAAAFFAIWLDPRTSAPALRAALLSQEAG